MYEIESKIINLNISLRLYIIHLKTITFQQDYNLVIPFNDNIYFKIVFNIR